jgi:hypothetical protein
MVEKMRLPRSFTKWCPKKVCCGRLEFLGNSKAKPWRCTKCKGFFDRARLEREYMRVIKQ